MTNQKTFWTTEQVERYLKAFPKHKRLELPNYVYVTENFTWNEVLITRQKNIDMPSRQVLENLKTSVDVLQDYRNKIGKPITITDSWRTPSEVAEMIRKYEIEKRQADLEKRKPRLNKPSSTSLHLEGLALDFQVQGISSHTGIYNSLNDNFLGELEHDTSYTHIGLPTFSEGYLKRHGIYSDKIYRKLSIDGIELTPFEEEKIIKRIEASDWKEKPSTFDPKKNIESYKDLDVNLKNKTILEEKKSQYNEEYEKIRLTDFVPYKGSKLPIGPNYATKEQHDEYAELYERELPNIAARVERPTREDLNGLVDAGDLIYVHEYTRRDGTKISGYFRHRPMTTNNTLV